MVKSMQYVIDSANPH